MQAGQANQKRKPVYVTESHHHVLRAWAHHRRLLPEAPRLFTLDYHTDTRSAFHRFGVMHASNARPWKKVAEEQLEALNYEDKDSVEDAIRNLHNDEHIDAAVQSRMVDIAFVAAYSDQNHIESEEQKALDAQRTNPLAPRKCAKPPYSYQLPENRIVILQKASIRQQGSGDARDRAYRDAAIEGDFLKQRIKFINKLTGAWNMPGLFKRPFILDIDLDYFNTRKAIDPNDTSVFYKLVCAAEIITIARESGCVKECQLEGEGLCSEFLQNELLDHIRRALTAIGQEMDLQEF